MPKNTYYNLSEEKRKKIYNTMLNAFENNSVRDVTVKEIVEQLNIPRGSFYQYFESIFESYFYILDRETVEVHSIFKNLVIKNRGDISISLEEFGISIADEIFNDNKYKLYKNRFLYMDDELEKKWKIYRKKNSNYKADMINIADKEKIAFISGVVHTLIKRLFIEEWNKDTFLKTYQLHIKWVEGGIIE